MCGIEGVWVDLAPHVTQLTCAPRLTPHILSSAAIPLHCYEGVKAMDIIRKLSTLTLLAMVIAMAWLSTAYAWPPDPIPW